jgi:predicted transposase YdaD
LGGRQQFDVAIKEILQQAIETLRQIGVSEVQCWLNVELPSTRNPRVDLLGETGGGRLVQVELHAHNDPAMPLRMLEYATAIRRRYGRAPCQVVVYVGREPMRMEARLVEEGLLFGYELLDFRNLNADVLIDQGSPEDYVLALLAGRADEVRIRRILKRIVRLPEEIRSRGIQSLLLISELRGLGARVQEEVESMPLVLNMLDSEVLGPPLRKALKEGREEGRQEGLETGRTVEARRMLRLQTERRFGALPAWADERIETLNREDAEALIPAILDATNVDSLFASGR